MEKFIEFLNEHKVKVIIGGGVLLVGIIILILINFKVIDMNINNKKDSDEKLVLEKKVEKVEEKEKEVKVEEQKEKQVYVDIKGAVNNPGIYTLSENSRVNDVINMAGGLKWNADLSVINLGKKIFDEMVIYIYTKDQVNNFIALKQEEAKKTEECLNSEIIKNDACVQSDNLEDNDSSSTATPSPSSKVSLNTATLEQLMTLSGIGQAKAESIIEYRNTNSGFTSIEDLKNVKGIGESIFDKIKENITI